MDKSVSKKNSEDDKSEFVKFVSKYKLSLFLLLIIIVISIVAFSSSIKQEREFETERQEMQNKYKYLQDSLNEVYIKNMTKLFTEAISLELKNKNIKQLNNIINKFDELVDINSLIIIDATNARVLASNNPSNIDRVITNISLLRTNDFSFSKDTDYYKINAPIKINNKRQGILSAEINY